MKGHPLLAHDPEPGDLADWPWIDFDALASTLAFAPPPGNGLSSLDRLLDRLLRETGRNDVAQGQNGPQPG